MNCHLNPKVLAVAVTVVALALGGGSSTAAAASGAAAPFELVFDGRQGPAAWSDLGWLHTGTFTASAPFCSAGTAADLFQEYPFPNVAVRSFTCDDGDGSISLRVGPFTAEGAFGATGSWAIVGGTGRYADLRGTGTWGTVAVDGEDPGTATFRTRLVGVAAFDAESPSITLRRSRVTGKPEARILRLVVATDDAEGSEVSYRVTTLAGGRVLGELEGKTTTGRPVSLRQPLRLPQRTRNVTVVVTATDPVGNERRLAYPVPLTPTG